MKKLFDVSDPTTIHSPTTKKTLLFSSNGYLSHFQQQQQQLWNSEFRQTNKTKEKKMFPKYLHDDDDGKL